MKLEEEPFLTAYLDDALDPEQRARVESAVACDPALAERLRALRVVRDAVATLSRPALQVDLAGAVLARIEGRRPSVFVRRALSRAGLLSNAPGRAAILLATAASLLVVASTTVVVTNWKWNSRSPGASPRDALAHHRPTPPAAIVAPAEPGTDAAAAVAAAPPEVVTAAPEAAPRDLVPTRDERLRDHDLQQVRQLLDDPRLHRIFVITDVVHGVAAKQVGDMLDAMPRKHARYVCLTVGPEAALDAQHPGESSVFAVVVDAKEKTQLKNDLRSKFPFDIEETEPKAETLTMLADVGRVAIYEGKPVADVIQPDRFGPAIKAVQPPTITIRPLGRPGDRMGGIFLPPRDDEPEMLAGGAQEPPRPEGAGGGAARVDRSPPEVILVWVTRPVR